MHFREFLHTVPFIRLLFPLILGIVLAEFLCIENWIATSLSLFSFTILLVYQFVSIFRKMYAYSVLYGVFIFLLCISIGAVRVHSTKEDMHLSSLDSIFAFKGNIKVSPNEKAKSITCVLNLKQVYKNENWEKANVQVLLYLAKDSLSKALKVGDEILVVSKLNQIKNNGNPNEFDYAKYLKYRHILYSTYVKGGMWEFVDKNEQISIWSLADSWRQKLLYTYKKVGLKNEAYEIVSALTLGARNEVSEDVRIVWAAAGATHVLAVSGLHVGIIFGVMQFLLSFLSGSKLKRFIRTLILILCLWMYALLTGLSPSVMRAASMFSIFAFALMINRKGTVYNSLMISASALLLYDPFVLFDLGFQFSYLAVASIIFFQPKFEKLIEVNSSILSWSWKLFTVSLAAQIGTFPLAIYYFHQFPSYFFLSNFVIIPVAGLLIYSSVLLLIFSEISFLSKWIAYILQNFVEFIHWLIYQIQALPGALIERITLSLTQVMLLYAFIIGLTLYLGWKKKKALLFSILTLIAFQFINIYEIYYAQSKELLVFNVDKQTVICIKDGQDILVLSDVLLDEKQKKRLIYPYGIKKRVKHYTYEILKGNELRILNGKRIAILGNSKLKKELKNLDLDYLISRNNADKYGDLEKEFEGKLMIRDASNYSQKNKLVENIQVWDTRLKGAYYLPLD